MAARLLGAADRVLEVTGSTVDTTEEETRQRLLAVAAEALGPERFRHGHDEGRSLDLADAVELLRARIASARPHA
jgi:hypothetical protein